MQPPQSNIVRDHPRKFMLGAIVIGVVGMNPVLAVMMLGVLGYAFMCWLDEDRFNSAQAQAWKRYEEAIIETADAQLISEVIGPDVANSISRRMEKIQNAKALS